MKALKSKDIVVNYVNVRFVHFLIFLKNCSFWYIKKKRGKKKVKRKKKGEEKCKKVVYRGWGLMIGSASKWLSPTAIKLFVYTSSMTDIKHSLFIYFLYILYISIKNIWH